MEFKHKLRRNQTVAEKIMWAILRNRRLKRYKFRRQHQIGPYIVDFICLKVKLIIELDGEHHLSQLAYDGKRTIYLESLGYKVIRFSNSDLFNRGEEVVNNITLILLHFQYNKV